MRSNRFVQEPAVFLALGIDIWLVLDPTDSTRNENIGSSVQLSWFVMPIFLHEKVWECSRVTIDEPWTLEISCFTPEILWKDDLVKNFCCENRVDADYSMSHGFLCGILAELIFIEYHDVEVAA